MTMFAAYICNILLIILELWGLRRRDSGFSWKMFAFYTQLSNVMALVSAVLFLVLRGQAAPVRYLACCMLLMTVFVTTCVLIPMGAGFKRMMLTGNGLFHHLLCPVLSVISYIFLEPHAEKIFLGSNMQNLFREPRMNIWLLPALSTLAYGVIMVILNGLGKVDGPYPFFRVRQQGIAKTLLWMAALFAVVSGMSALLALAA